jgi:hypothetical protein
MNTVVVGQIGTVFEDTKSFLLNACPGQQRWRFDFEKSPECSGLCEVFVAAHHWPLVLKAAKRPNVALIVAGIALYSPYPMLTGVIATKILVIPATRPHQLAIRKSLVNKLAVRTTPRSTR